MRYIDADKILYTDLSEGRGVCWVTFMDWIKEMPTADVRENVKGEWIEDNPREKSMMWRCSVCGRTAYYPTIGERKSYKKHCGYNYCPNCGADMRPRGIGKHADITIIDESVCADMRTKP